MVISEKQFEELKMPTIVQTIVSLSVLGIMGIIILIFDNLATPQRRGFFEKDQNLLYPYHPSTVKAFILHIVGILIPLCLILLHYFVKSGRSGSGRKKWKENFVVIALPTFIGYLFGAGATEILTMVGKYNAGRLRPHFFSVCKPGNYSTNVDLEYIEEYDCGGNSIQFPIEEERNKRIREVSLSFPSGHASFAFQAATFTVLYLQAKFSKNDFARKSLLVPFTQIVMIAAAFFVAVSRVMDYKHHPTDVIAGGLIGTIIQILNCFGATLIFSEDEVPLASRSEESIALRTRNENETPKQS